MVVYFNYEKNSYYNMGLKVLSDKQKVVSSDYKELLENHYYTKSMDNYINFRSEPGSKTTVISKLPNNTEVIKIGMQGEWLYTKLARKPLIQGYIQLNELEYIDNY